MQTDRDIDKVEAETKPITQTAGASFAGANSPRKSINMWGAIVAIVISAAATSVAFLQKGKSRFGILFGGILAAAVGGIGIQYVQCKWPFHNSARCTTGPTGGGGGGGREEGGNGGQTKKDLTNEEVVELLWSFMQEPSGGNVDANAARELVEKHPALLANDRELWIDMVKTSMYLKDRELTDALLKDFFAKPLGERDLEEYKEVVGAAADFNDDVIDNRLNDELPAAIDLLNRRNEAHLEKSIPAATLRPRLIGQLKSGNTSVIDKLLEANPGIELLTDERGYTSLHHVVRNLSFWESGTVVPIAKLLLEHNPKLAEAKTHEGHTPAQIINVLYYDLDFPDQSETLLELLHDASQMVERGPMSEHRHDPSAMERAVAQYHSCSEHRPSAILNTPVPRFRQRSIS